jgi:sulfur relay (sulfurtransferase) DsrC/TusE family protein
MRFLSATVLAFSILAISACSVQQIQKTVDGYLKDAKPTTEEVASGLKEALEKGITNGAKKASAVDGYFKNPQIKIPFPPDVRKVETKLRQLGMDKQVDQFIETLNRGAEEAAKQAAPIFVSAIKQMTINDAWNILKGDKDAATQYLQKTTTSQLEAKFKPVIQKALDKVNATKYYGDLVNTYNKIPFVDKVNPDLNDYATTLAIDGLFKLVAQEEANIRNNPGARTTELLKKVFKEQDN